MLVTIAFKSEKNFKIVRNNVNLVPMRLKISNASSIKEINVVTSLFDSKTNS